MSYVELRHVEPLAVFCGDSSRANDLNGLVTRSVSASHIIICKFQYSIKN